MSSYKKAGTDVRNMLNELLTQFGNYHPLLDARVTFDLLFAMATRDDEGMKTGPAISKNGMPCLGLASKSSLKDRALGRSDCLIILDGDWWLDLDTEPKQRRALLDHELYHFIVVTDDIGEAKLDTCKRPQIEIRHHDFEFGWFKEIAERHGEFSQERIQAAAILENAPQLFWPEITDPKSVGKTFVKSAAALVKNVGKKGSGISSMTISSGDQSVTIDANGAEAIRKSAEAIENKS